MATKILLSCVMMMYMCRNKAGDCPVIRLYALWCMEKLNHFISEKGARFRCQRELFILWCVCRYFYTKSVLWMAPVSRENLPVARESERHGIRTTSMSDDAFLSSIHFPSDPVVFLNRRSLVDLRQLAKVDFFFLAQDPLVDVVSFSLYGTFTLKYKF